MYYVRSFIYLITQCEIEKNWEKGMYSGIIVSTINSFVNNWCLTTREQYFSCILIIVAKFQQHTYFLYLTQCKIPKTVHHICIFKIVHFLLYIKADVVHSILVAQIVFARVSI